MRAPMRNASAGSGARSSALRHTRRNCRTDARVVASTMADAVSPVPSNARSAGTPTSLKVDTVAAIFHGTYRRVSMDVEGVASVILWRCRARCRMHARRTLMQIVHRAIPARTPQELCAVADDDAAV